MTKTKRLSLLYFILFSYSSMASTNGGSQPQYWRLPQYLFMAKQEPGKLLNLAESFFDQGRLKRAKIEAVMADDWRDRSALLSSLATLWTSKSKITTIQKKRAKALLVGALMNDSALLVRDAAAESIREILRAQPGLAPGWRISLEEAFLSENNRVKGEGLFIRETLLSIMYEAGLKPSKKIKVSAKQDLNPQVRALLDQWDSANFQTLSF